MICSPIFLVFLFLGTMILQSGKREKKKNEATRQGPRKYRRRGRGMRETTASAAASVTTSTFFFFFATVLLRHEPVRSSAKLEETHGCGNGHALFFVPVLLKIVPFFGSCFVLCRFPLLARRIIKAIWQMPQRIAKGSALTSRSIRSGAPIGEKCKL
jgi:hypothetical protein